MSDDQAQVLRDCCKAYRRWLMYVTGNTKNNYYTINVYAIKKSREMIEVDEVEGYSNRFTVEKSSA